MGTKGPFASVKQKLIKNGLFLQSARQDGGEMIQISHGRHVNVQEHRGVNSLAAQARCSPGLPAGDRGWDRAVLPAPSPAPSLGTQAGHGWNSAELWLLEHRHSVPAWHHLPTPLAPAQRAASTSRLSWNITYSTAAISTLILYFLFSPLANKLARSCVWKIPTRFGQLISRQNIGQVIKMVG